MPSSAVEFAAWAAPSTKAPSPANPRHAIPLSARASKWRSGRRTSCPGICFGWKLHSGCPLTFAFWSNFEIFIWKNLNFSARGPGFSGGHKLDDRMHRTTGRVHGQPSARTFRPVPGPQHALRGVHLHPRTRSWIRCSNPKKYGKLK